ncbi:MAG: cyanophycin synthetase [Pleurocapsa sp.]
MKILKIDTLKGANYWSCDRQHLIVVYLDLEADLRKFNAKIPVVYQCLNKLLPSIEEDFYCLENYHESESKISLAMTIIKVALELQNLAGISVNFGCASTSAIKGIEQIVFEYQTPTAGRYAAKAAVRICQSLIKYNSYPQTELVKDLQYLKTIHLAVNFAPATQALLREAESRQIPWLELPVQSLIQLGYGKHQRRISFPLCDRHSFLRFKLAENKLNSQTLLRTAGLPVPNSRILFDWHDMETAIKEVGGYPVAIKPLDGKSRRGITLNINNLYDALAAYNWARQQSKSALVVIEKHACGLNYRLLVVNGKVVAGVSVVTACVIGDGVSTIVELVEQINCDRSFNDGRSQIKINRESKRVLQRQGYTARSVPQTGEVVYLKETPHFSTGATTCDRTDKIHPENVWLAQRAAKIIGLELAEINLICQDISLPLSSSSGVIIGVNHAPQLDLYLKPDFGQPRPIAASILDWLYPPDSPARIPIVAVTGSTGKSSVVNLIAHIFQQSKQVVGYTSVDRTYINGYEIDTLECAEFEGSELILQDPTVDVAVLSVTDAQIRESGLRVDRCDVAVILDLSVTDVETIFCYSIVAEAVKNEGYVVLNADEPGIEAIAKQVTGTVVYFSTSLQNCLLQQHLFQGGMGAIYHNGYLSLLKEKKIIPIELGINVPLISNGFNSQALSYTLAASLVAYLQGVSIANISTALRTFKVRQKIKYSPINLINLGKYHLLLLDSDNLIPTVSEFILNWQQGDRLGIIGVNSDRSEAELIELGTLAAQIFDRLIVKENDEQSYTNPGKVAQLIAKGIEQQKPNFNYELILDETTAIKTALSQAESGSLIIILSQQLFQAISFLQFKKLPNLLTFE